MPEESVRRNVFNGHILLTPRTCNCRWTGKEGHCPVCDWGLSVCANCNAAEVELDRPCTGQKQHEPPIVKPAHEPTPLEMELYEAEMEADFYGRSIMMKDHLEELRRRVEAQDE